MGQDVLAVEDLVKKYGEFTAVGGITFALQKGEVVGLLGPNGAGKTTTIQCLLGVTQATNGMIHYFGKDFTKHRQEILQRINFTTAYASLQGRTSVYENLRVFAGLYEVRNPDRKIAELSSILEMGEIMQQQYWHLSSGQRTRVNLAKALLNDPELIFMDEPTASLDPDIADRVLTWIEQIHQQQAVTILYTSHNMDEVARICDRVIFLDRGQIVAMDTPLGLTKRIKNAKLILTYDATKKIVENFLKEKKISFTFPRSQVVELEISEAKIPSILFGLSKIGVWITDIDIKKPNLENVFLDIARGGKNVLDKN